MATVVSLLNLLVEQIGLMFSYPPVSQIELNPMLESSEVEYWSLAQEMLVNLVKTYCTIVL